MIATAPQKRLAIKTFVAKGGDGIIREAILRELEARRPGVFPAQRDRDHREHARTARGIVPEARVRVGHGQMGRTSWKA